MHWRIAIIFAVLLAQGCQRHPITWSFPAYHTDDPEARIAGFNVTIQGASLISVENMDPDNDWDLTFETGWVHSAMTGKKCYPIVTGTCHHGAGTFSDSRELPRLVLRPDAGTNTVKISGCFQLLRKWDDESTPDITFTNMMPRQ